MNTERGRKGIVCAKIAGLLIYTYTIATGQKVHKQ
jgi:hypothetical protein